MNRISKSIGFSFLIVFTASLSLGYWIKIKQLNAISDRLLSHYPVSWFATTIFQVLLVFIALWLVLAVILRSIDQSDKLNQVLLISAVPFLVFLIPLLDITESSFAFQAQLFLMIAAVVLLRAFSRNRSVLMNTLESVSVLGLLALVFLLLLQSFSPLSTINPLLGWLGRSVEWTNFEHQWEMAKAFDYSVPNFTQFAKLGGTTTGVFYFSELISLLMLLLDVPIVDLEAKYIVVNNLLFCLYIFASFGMYLFLRYGLGLSLIPSLIGGLGTIFGNGAITSFFGFEYITHHGDYLFLPWVFLFLKLGYKKNSIGLIGLAGLISTLAEYVLSPHPSLSMLSYFFLNIYNIFLALKNSWVAEKWENRSKLFFCWVMIFPSFIAIGMAFRYLPLFILSLENDFGVTSYNAGGMPWVGKLQHIASLFFHYETMPGISNYHVGPSGSQILFTTGQFITFFIFSLIVYLFFRRQKSSPLRANDLVSQQDVWFFLVTFLLILINAWWGVSSPYAAISRFFEMGLVKYFSRLNIYFFFFAIITAMYGLHFLCKTKNTKILDVTFVFYIAVLGLMYLTPALTPVKPESKHLIFDAIVLIFIYKSFLLYFNLKREPQGDQGHVFLKSLLLDLLLIIALLFAIIVKGKAVLNDRVLEWLVQNDLNVIILKGKAVLNDRVLEWLMQNGLKLICIPLGVILFIVFFRSKLSFGKTFKTPLALPLVAGKLPSFMTVGFPLVLNSLLFAFFLLGFSFLVPFHDANVDGLTRDGVIFFCIYLVVLFVFFNWKPVQNEGHRVFIYPVIVLISLVTFITQNDDNRRFLHLMADKIPKTYVSMRTALTQYRNNTHDQASLNYLKTRWEQFIIDLKDKGKTDPSNFPLISSANDSGLDSNSLEYYEKVSPLMDEFYLGSLTPKYFKGYFHADVSPHHSLAPLVADYYGASQYYLPDDYSLYFYGENQSGGAYPYIRPTGKNADINSYPLSTLASSSRHFPSINVYFHLLYIYNKPVPDISMEKWKIPTTYIEGYPFPTRTLLDKIQFDNSFTRKLMNIIGLDYFLYREEGYPDLEDKLKATGFIPTNIAESVRVKILKNPDSYGRAYIADWVKTIKPEEDFKNRYNSFNAKSEWAWDLSLQKNFLDLIASLPDDYPRATLIESSDPDEYSPEPTIHANESQVDIVKILATKAMFEIDAQEDNTWFVYNSAALKGWKAFSGSREVPIKRANLGFMGIKLNKGKHLVWMEYRPVSLFIGLTVTLAGWIMVALYLLRYSEACWNSSLRLEKRRKT